MGRPHTLADPEKAKQVATMFAEGATRQEIADTMGISDLDTVTRWRRDPRVKQIAHKIIDDRILEVTRKVDSVIAARLQDAQSLTMKELLEVRKEFLGGRLRERTHEVDDETVAETMEAIESGDDLIGRLEEAFEKATAKKE